MTATAQQATALPTIGNALVASNIRAELGYSNLSQGALAAALGMSEMSLSRRLNDSNSAQFSADEIHAAADFFRIDPGQLFAQRRGANSGRLYGIGTSIHRVVGPTGLEPMTSTV